MADSTDTAPLRAVRITPDLECEQVRVRPAVLHDPALTRVPVQFVEGGEVLVALVDADSAHPNAAASLGRAAAATGNSAFFADPSRALCGTVLIVGPQDSSLSDAALTEIHDGVRAAQDYREDLPVEFRLWKNAARNLGAEQG
ncbi:hypothetical protein ACUY3K_03510 [Corynebacterium uberis]|uniref:hypothetical protein n=1 Tax=Corynebacterium TaxID=1716 RepID=UPI001D09FEFF|nr:MULTISPECIES: hypothetical protein [Corynebacterium]MCZ9309341.1 hypothetical protein [Corynebacterium sp. c6VSa_13]UDL72890.1 hypothetical protein LH391_07150 [Corynebacterium uberis]UDL76233.1 hypothetical protein LH393_02245 [Corynebacterium uberis]UDL78445.1 hypothetical protein LH394_02235 [Corynebacterium uberis]UDL80728.1 hypothetical protein LH392_02665 [Corynebacterium uberis]